jgi:hypothetical protein
VPPLLLEELLEDRSLSELELELERLPDELDRFELLPEDWFAMFSSFGVFNFLHKKCHPQKRQSAHGKPTRR